MFPLFLSSLMDMEILTLQPQSFAWVYVCEQTKSVVYAIQAILRFAIQSTVENLF